MAIEATRAVVNIKDGDALREQLLMEETIAIKAAAADDRTEAVAAFLENRAPVFTGR